MEKTCFKCGETKPRTEFYAHSGMSGGLLGKCKACTCKDVRQHRIANSERVREYDRARANEPHRVELRKALSKRERDNHPDRTKARYTVGNAIRDGKLIKSPCAFCQSDGPVEAHHHDYTKPLDVTWLCKPCHRRFHALERMATYGESGKVA